MVSKRGKNILIILSLCFSSFILGGYISVLTHNYYLKQKAGSFYTVGYDFYKKGNNKEALSFFNRSIGIRDNYESYIKIGEIYLGQGDSLLSLSAFQHGLALLDNNMCIIDLDKEAVKYTKEMITKKIYDIKCDLEKTKKRPGGTH